MESDVAPGGSGHRLRDFDHPAEPYIRPERAFASLHPVLQSSIHVLKSYGVSPQQAISGRGNHLVWAIRSASQAFKLLSSLSRLPMSLAQRYDRPHRPAGEAVDLELGRAYAGLGMLFEFVGIWSFWKQAQNHPFQSRS